MHGKQNGPIQEITLDTHTFHKVSIQPTLVNFFYGKNGTGKSTIADELRQHHGISPAIDDYELLVYDKQFIDRNFQEDALPGVFSLNESNIEIQNSIEEKTKQREKAKQDAEEKRKALDGKNQELSSARKDFEKTCWDAAEELKEKFPEAFKGCSKSKNKLADRVLAVEEPEEQNLAQIASLYQAAFDDKSKTYPLLVKPTFPPIETLPGFHLLNTTIISSSDTPYATFIRAIGATDWVRQGHEHFHDTPDHRCPYCHQPLPDDFEDQLAACFDEQYEQDIASLKTFIRAYRGGTEKLLRTLIENQNTEFADNELSVYEDQVSALASLIELNCHELAGKEASPAQKVTLKGTSKAVAEIEHIIDEINARINEHNKAVKSKKASQSTCTDAVWKHLAYKLQPHIQAFLKAQAKLKKEQETLQNEKEALETAAANLQSEIAGLASKTVNIDSTMEAINKGLTDSGFQGFRLKKSRKVSGKYQIVRDDDSPARGLSEGEKNFISFLYFYYKISGRESADDTFKDRIVVIDDPISSMDSNSLFIVSSIIRHLIGICRNNGTAAPDGAPLYIRQMFILTHNAFFHNEISYNVISKYSCVNFYHIRKRDNSSTIEWCKRRDPLSEQPALEHNFSPVKNAYATLWKEYKVSDHATVLLRLTRQILEYYFIQISGYEGQTLEDRIKEHIEDFIEPSPDGTQNTSLLHLASALLKYTGDSQQAWSDGFDYVDGEEDPKQIKHAFQKIFEVMGQKPHYEMMMAQSV